MAGQHTAKRVKLSDDAIDTSTIRERRAAFLNSLSRAVSPPTAAQSTAKRLAPTSLARLDDNRPLFVTNENIAVQVSESSTSASTKRAELQHSEKARLTDVNRVVSDLPSPVQLTKIRDLSLANNTDTISLNDILGDPLIKEAWIFNFCFDVDWLMSHFDADVREMVQVKIIHGSWRNEDMNKIQIDDACRRRSNVEAIQAYLPDAFGTHHSKMFILFRHDEYAQVVIHTANMLEKDWTNMTQAVWRSPLLPIARSEPQQQLAISNIGACFKSDLMGYLRAYGNKLKPLTQQLETCDFDNVKAALVGSVPSKFKLSAPDNEVWGHEMLRRKLRNLVIKSTNMLHSPHYVFQVSSIASLASNWLDETLYQACASSKEATSIIFPTASDVAKSLDGYAAGGSIHTKAQKPVHLKQISAMRPQLCRWTQGSNQPTRSGRGLAAPHIKTYIRFASRPSKQNPAPSIDWALVTSANLSTQAWGSAPKLAKGEKNAREGTVHIQSFEIGVLVWPELYRDGKKSDTEANGRDRARMVPTFKSDMPATGDSHDDLIVGFRMPYDLPLTPYGPDEMPWSSQSSYEEPDRHGRMWQ